MVFNIFFTGEHVKNIYKIIILLSSLLYSTQILPMHKKYEKILTQKIKAIKKEYVWVFLDLVQKCKNPEHIFHNSETDGSHKEILKLHSIINDNEELAPEVKKIVFSIHKTLK